MERLFGIDPWKLTSDTVGDNKRLQESLTAIGNGYMGLRGNFEEGYSGDTHIGTYIAGVWFPDKTKVGWWKIGYPDYFGKVINATNFIPVDIYVDEHKVDLAIDTVEQFHLELDMKEGVLRRSFIWKKEEVSILFRFTRFVSAHTKELAVVNIEAEMLTGIAELTLIPHLDGNVENEDSNYEEQFWNELEKGHEPFPFLKTKTKENPFGTERFTVTTMMSNQTDTATKEVGKEQAMYVGERFFYPLEAGDQLTLTKYIAVITSRDVVSDQQVEKAANIIQSARDKGLQSVLKDHLAEWETRWNNADVQISGDDASQQGIRFNILQLFSTYYGEDPRLNVGPKGFTGEKYGGATYWDTEACILPMYLSVTNEGTFRQLLVYRHNQLEQAYENAAKQGLKGALYPMVTFTGIECHNEWEITFEEIHRNGAIAHGIFNYTTYTGNEDYLLNQGIDVLVGIARFWADRVHYSARKQQYMIHGVTGPNEYENNVSNNWYTNTMAQWCLQYTLETLEKVTDDKIRELKVSEEEQQKWTDISGNMYLPKDEALAVFVQHDSFLDKDLRPVNSLDPSERPINQNWSWDKILRSPFIKQADVLQGLYFLNHHYSQEEKERNFNFYEPMTVHESSLSPLVHSILASELGKKEKAFEMYERTARLDLDNYNNDTEDGLHITSMSGGWLSIVQGFAGMRTQTGTLSFAPYCPDQWDSYRFKLNYRERLLNVAVEKTAVTFQLEVGESLIFEVFGQSVTLEDTLTIAIEENSN
ncbi:glycoside hydrolase family 65 protein [Marinilactibacillus psychrotolerans]|uniref:Maltose phosphorylase n=1 Tax=Marinilactibacillus psychrotolerans TaxID=191770 RepID=A0AAV3WSL9_9LACT|nr:glycoside hydrolase family 65 protein [Marinilactibacillus psychrotolerans]GEL67497.1 maltose phosphorylase [Marinilactibacillus psychrotolerans]GEQ35658.1 maltose phosphorylase [Marinilactibacillus psychrotolerans]SDC72466.1 maltose phosphorylase [Marinilactibacillus psychrotolerans]